jgi:signal transduction histidine kinase
VLLNSKLFRTSTFRLAALYLTVFALSVGAILAYVYMNTAGILERQVDETIRAEVLALADQYNVLGIEGVANLIERRTKEDSATLYSLTTRSGKHVAGGLKTTPDSFAGEQGWVDFPMSALKNGVIVRRTGRGYHAALPGGYDVVVGRDIGDLRLFSDLIRRTLFLALGLTVLLGIGGGLLMSRNFLRRIDAITGTSRTIMSGDLTHRMPVRGTNDELDRLSVSLNEMLDQIERLMNGMKDVSSNVAHDLKTPLTRLRARVEAALRGNDSHEYREALTATIQESDELLKTFNALLSIARAEAGQMRAGLLPSDLKEILEDVAELYQPLIEDAGGTLSLQSPTGLMVKVDRQLMTQCLINLLDNAMKYGAIGRQPAITISAQSNSEVVELVIADRGPGIPAEQRERVKDRFVRLDASRSKPGNGLGLSLVASVMKLHGGQLLLEDNEPGLRAKLVLPSLAATS